MFLNKPNRFGKSAIKIMLPKDTLQLILDTGKAQNAIQTGDDGEKFFIKPDGNVTGLGNYNKPTRVRQKVAFTDAESFAKYFTRFATVDSLIFGDIDTEGAKFTAVLDYHKPGVHTDAKSDPNYCDHVATFNTMPTPEWDSWRKANRRNFTQIEFATWLEDNLHLFTQKNSGANKVGPTAAELLELVKTLHGKQSANFGQTIRLDNGAHSCHYEESVTVQGAGRTGTINLPAFIYGGFPMFQGMPNYLITARLKTKLDNRKLVIWFETVALEKTVLDCLNIVTKRIEEKTKREILIGSLVGK